MKCIRCDANSTYKQRKGGNCRACNHPFAFEPKKIPETGTHWRLPLTDGAFKAAIDAVSDNANLQFTPRQLYYQVIKPKMRRRRLPASRQRTPYVVAGIVFVLVMILLWSANRPAFFALIVITVVGAVIVRVNAVRQDAASRLAAPPPVTYDFFVKARLKRWLQIHGAPARMIPEGGRPRNVGAHPSSDISQFSFDRLLVVDKAETADMLLANNLHFETSMPIVTFDGYPPDVFTVVMEMVRRNPRLAVFTLHDCDPAGCALPVLLREREAWFPSPFVTVLDIGLRPLQVAAMPGVIVQRDDGKPALPAELTRLLTPAERRWLESGRRVELASFQPSRLMRVVYQFIQRSGDEQARLEAERAVDARGFFDTRLDGSRSATETPVGFDQP